MSATFKPPNTTAPASPPSPPDRLGTKDYRVAEYTALRGEILKHMDIEYQVSTLSITAFGALTTLGGLIHFLNAKDGALLLFLYPILALLLSCRWRYSDRRIIEIGAYIRDHIEVGIEEVKGVRGWEDYLDRHNRFEKTLLPGLYRLSAWGIFFFTEVLAILIGVASFVLQKQLSFLPAVGFSLLFTSLTLLTLLKEPKSYGTHGQDSEKADDDKITT